MTKKKTKPVTQMTDKQKNKAFEAAVIRNRADMPSELLVLVDHPELWIDWKDKYGKLHMALENVVAYAIKRFDLDGDALEELQREAGLPPDYVDYHAKYDSLRDEFMALQDTVADGKEAEAAWKNDEVAARREIAHLKRKLDEIDSASMDHTDDPEQPDPVE